MSKILRQEVTVTYPDGLHLTPLGILSHRANQFQADLRITHKDRTASCKETPLTLALLNAPCDSVVVLEAEGADAEEAMAAMVELFETDFGLGHEAQTG